MPRPDNKKHGDCKERLYGIWHSMKNRANGTSNQYNRKIYAHVDMCEEWQDYLPFKDWALANGYADTLTIDRIDNSKGYYPDNCRWATMAEQAQNRRNTRFNSTAIRDMRNKYAAGARLTDLAREHGTCPSSVLKIVKQQRWRNVDAKTPVGVE